MLWSRRYWDSRGLQTRAENLRQSILDRSGATNSCDNTMNYATLLAGNEENSKKCKFKLPMTRQARRGSLLEPNSVPLAFRSGFALDAAVVLDEDSMLSAQSSRRSDSSADVGGVQGAFLDILCGSDGQPAPV